MATASQSIDRSASYINHLSHIQNIQNPNQIQYLNFIHSVAWTFNKEKKRKAYFYLIIFLSIK